MKKTTVAVISDLHINSSVGLLKDGALKLRDGQTVSQSPAQEWLWEKFENFLEFEKRGKVVTIINGEIADSLHHRTTQLLTNDPSSIIDMAVATIDPIVAISDTVIVTKGTEAHSGLGSHLDEIIAREIGADRLGTHDYAHWWASLSLDGVKFDVAHHPRFGSGSYHTSHNTAGKLAADVMMYCAKFGGEVPDVLIRSHNHTFSDSGLNYPVRAFVTPPWQLGTHFSHRLGYGGKMLPVGGLVFYCRKGNYEVSSKLYTPKRTGYVEVA